MRLSALTTFALLAGTLGLAPPAAAQSFTGCGPTFGTCASVTVSTAVGPAGTWIATVTVQNTSALSSIVMAVDLVGFQAGTGGGGQVISAIDGNGNNVLPFTNNGGYSEPIGIWGYQERMTMVTQPDGTEINEVVWGQYSGAYSDRCAASPECDATRAHDVITSHGTWSDTLAYGYFQGPITYQISLTVAPPAEFGVNVTHYFVGGGWNNSETYALTPATTVTPEPVTLSLLATGLAGVGLARRRRRATGDTP